MPNCTKCDKTAVVLNNVIPYCVKCYTKTFKKSHYRRGHFSNRKREG